MPKRKPKDNNRSPDLPHNWIERHIERLRSHLFTDPLPVDDWTYRLAQLTGPATYTTLDQPRTTIRLGETWGGPDATAFFERTLQIPASHVGPDTFLDIDMDGGETQLSINGKPWQGLDHFRSHVPLGSLALSGEALRLEMEAFVINYPYDARRGDEREEHIFRRASLVIRDPAVEACYFDITFVFDAYMHLWETDEDLDLEEFLRRHLEEACRLLGPSFSSQAEASSRAANSSDYLRANVFGNEAFRRTGTINVCAHSHLDVVYLWPIKETFRKNGRTTSNALSLLREYPDYIFSQSQPFLYQQLQLNYPELFDDVKEMVQAGRWEVLGAMYIEPDGNLPGPESWVRQIMFGKRFLRDELGTDSRICWLPDVFGVMYTLPQILKKGGVDYFLTAKLNIWNDTTVFPCDSFRWRGLDGSEVIAHFPPTHFAQDFTYGNLRRQWSDYREKHVAEENLFIYGWGDGGGGPTRMMVEHSHRIAHFPGLPSVRAERTEPFFDRLAEKADRLPVWDDELYMEGHRGTYTSKGSLKRANRKAEILYRDVEMLSSFAAAFGGPAIQQRLNEGWKHLLLNQFHDTLPGTHIAEAMPDIMDDYQASFEIGHAIRDELLEFFAAHTEGTEDVLVFNTLHARQAVVKLSAAADVTGIAIGTDAAVAVQHCDGRIVFDAPLPSLGWVSARLITGGKGSGETTAIFDGETIQTAFYRFELGQNGVIARLYDKIHDRDVLAGGGNVFQVFEDDPGKSFGAWDIAYHLEEYSYPVSQIAGWKLVDNGPVFARFKCRWSVLNSTIDQYMTVYSRNRRIDFETQIEWRDSKKLLKVAFPLNIRSRTATFDLPFGHIERSTHRNTGFDQAKFEVCGHKWADMSEGNYGVALLNDCKYGYDVKGNVMRLSLLRSPVRPTPDSDIGEHVFSYALLPHSGGWREAGVDRSGYEFNIAPMTVQKTAAATGRTRSVPANQSFAAVDSAATIIEAIKQAEDGEGLILRAFDSHGTHDAVKFSFAPTIAGVTETNLLEEALVEMTRGENDFGARLSPYEIKTFRVKLKPVGQS